MAKSREAELQAFGCKNPEWFLRDHIPRYADHYGVGFFAAYQAVLAEIVALDEVRRENFRQMVETGMAHRMLQIYARRGDLGKIGERPLVVVDNYVYMMRRVHPDDPRDHETIYYDPGIALAVRNFRTMDDPIPTQCVDSITIGRPNSEGELWLSDGIAVEDYDVVRDCFNRLLALRTGGITPHMISEMDHIYVPYTLGDPEHPYDPDDWHHGPVDYTTVTTELKVA